MGLFSHNDANVNESLPPGLLVRRINTAREANACTEGTLYRMMQDRNGDFAFFQVHGKIPSDLQNFEVYHVAMQRNLPPVEFECSVVHDDACGKKINSTFFLGIELVLTPAFASWMKFNKKTQVTFDDLARELQKPESGVQDFIQEVILDNDLSSVLKRVSSSLWVGQHRAMMDWIEVTSILVKSADMEKTELEKRGDAFNKLMQERRQTLHEAQENLKLDIEFENIEEARKEIERQKQQQAAEEEAARRRMQKELEVEELKAECEKQKQLVDLEAAKTAAGQQQQAGELRIDILKQTLLIKQVQLDKAQKELEASETNRETSKAVNEELKQMLAQLKDRLQEQYYSGLHCGGGWQPPQFVTDALLKQKSRHPVTMDKKSARAFSTRNLRFGGVSPAMFSPKDVGIGEKMQFSFRSGRSGFLTLICIGSSCQPTMPTPNGPPLIQLLEPNFIDGAQKVEADREYAFPGPEFLPQYQNDMRQDGPAGVERIVAIVTDRPMLELPSDLRDIYTLSYQEYRQLLDRLDEMDADSWSAGVLTYNVVAKE